MQIFFTFTENEHYVGIKVTYQFSCKMNCSAMKDQMYIIPNLTSQWTRNFNILLVLFIIANVKLIMYRACTYKIQINMWYIFYDFIENNLISKSLVPW